MNTQPGFNFGLKKFVCEMCGHINDIVYGSYARGDFNFQSDVDIMILVQSSEDEIKKFENDVYDCAFDLELKYGKVVSPVIKNQHFFDYWSDTLPFYRDILKEGVRVA